MADKTLLNSQFHLDLMDDLAEFYDDPLGHVMYSYPWDTDPALQVVNWENEEMFVDPTTGFIYSSKPNSVQTVTYAEWMAPYRERFNSSFGPDKWACDWLDEVGREVAKRGFDGVKSVPVIQMATSSGHGIGKSTLAAWTIKWIMDTRPRSKGTVTANTSEQLRTKTWAELSKWHRRSMTSWLFDYSSSRGNMSLSHIELPEEWRCNAYTCREENSEAFAGQHAAGATSFYLFDEASAVPSKIYEVRDGGTILGEPMVFDFGNGTRNTGKFYEECQGKLKHRFRVRKIDSRSVAITNKERIKQWVDDYGEDSDFVKVRVRGDFPSAGSLQFMPADWVRRAAERPDVNDRNAALTIGVDVARFGVDNSVIYPVHGHDARSFAPVMGDGIYNGLDNVQLAMKVVEKIQYFEDLGVPVSAVFVDVGGTGSGVVDTLKHQGYACVEVNFGTSPVYKPETYRYRTDEIWGRLKDRIKDTLVLPQLPLMGSEEDIVGNAKDRKQETAVRLFEDLTQRQFGYTLAGEKISLESKTDMRSRGIPSPDIADALALNFALDVARMREAYGGGNKQVMTEHEFDPLEDVHV